MFVIIRKKRALFTGDFVYECGHGSSLFDWTARASIPDYLKSAHYMIDWLNEHEIDKIYPGHYSIMNAKNVQQLLKQYIDSKR